VKRTQPPAGARAALLVAVLIVAAAAATSPFAGAATAGAGEAPAGTGRASGNASPAPLASSPPAPLTSTPPTTAALTEAILADDKFTFCHDQHYPLTKDEARWCPALQSSGPPCPAFGQTCQGGVRAAQVARVERRREVPVLSLPPALVLTLLALVVAISLFFIGRSLWRARTAGRDRGAGDAADGAEGGAADGAEVPAAALAETDVERLLARARQAADAGDFGRAVIEVHAALLRRLEGEGIVEVHPHRTNGDYARAVERARPALAPALRDIVTDVEVTQFGGVAAGAPLYESLLGRATKLIRATLAAMVLALPFGALLGCGPHRPGWEHSPSGRAAVIELLRRSDIDCRERLTSVASLPKGSSARALVLLPGASLSGADWDRLQRWVLTEGGTLVVAGVPQDAPAWLSAATDPDVRAATGLVRPPTRPEDDDVVADLGDVRATLPPSPRLVLVNPDIWEPLLVRGGVVYAAQRGWNLGDDGGEAGEAGDQEGGEREVVANDNAARESAAGEISGDEGAEGEASGEMDGDDDEVSVAGTLIVIADDRLFTNAALAFPENAEALLALVRYIGEDIEIIGELAGLVASSPLASVRRGRLAPFLLQLALLVGVFFLHKGVHFGRPRDPELASRREFLEHVEAVGRAYARARAAAQALRGYGTYALERLHQRMGMSVGRGIIGLAEALAARTGRSAGEIARLLVEVREATDATAATAGGAGAGSARGPRPSRRDVEPHLRVLGDLCELVNQTGGSRDRR
jgi:hypothetical protein